METDTKWLDRVNGLIGPRKPSGDRLGEVYELIDPDEQRQMLMAIHHKLQRNKVLQNDWRYCVFYGSWAPNLSDRGHPVSVMVAG